MFPVTEGPLTECLLYYRIGRVVTLILVFNSIESVNTFSLKICGGAPIMDRSKGRQGVHIKKVENPCFIPWLAVFCNLFDVTDHVKGSTQNVFAIKMLFLRKESV